MSIYNTPPIFRIFIFFYFFIFDLFSSYKLLAISCSINDEEQLAIATQFLHNLGSLIHFPSRHSGLSDLVILKPQFLPDLMCTVVTTKLTLIKNGVLLHKVSFSCLPAPPLSLTAPPSIFSLCLSLSLCSKLSSRTSLSCGKNTNLHYTLSSFYFSRSLASCAACRRRPRIFAMLPSLAEQYPTLSLSPFHSPSLSPLSYHTSPL